MGSQQRTEPDEGARSHLHDELRLRLVEQRDGVPHEFRRVVCRECGALLREEHVRRTAA